MSQLESVNVTNPPVPALLPVKHSISSKNVGSRSVVVNDSHFEPSMSLLNGTGLPNSGFRFEIVSHRAHSPPVSFVFSSGADVIEPRLEAAVIEPIVTNTRSSLAISIVLGVPFRNIVDPFDGLAIQATIEIKVRHLAVHQEA